MFTQIIDSPARTKLATFFLISHPRSFHPEEVRRAVAEPGAVVAVTLKHFAKQGFLKAFERRGEVYYHLNIRYPYIEELRGFLVKKQPFRIKDPVAQELEHLNNTVLVVLSGLFTGQSAIPTDLVIVGRPTPASLKKAIERVEKELRQEINYTVFTEDEFNERVNMYERFTRDLFDNHHVVVLDRRAKKSKDLTAKTKKAKR